MCFKRPLRFGLSDIGYHRDKWLRGFSILKCNYFLLDSQHPFHYMFTVVPLALNRRTYF